MLLFNCENVLFQADIDVLECFIIIALFFVFVFSFWNWNRASKQRLFNATRDGNYWDFQNESQINDYYSLKRMNSCFISGDLATVQDEIRKGIDINIDDTNKNSALHFAAYHGKLHWYTMHLHRIGANILNT